MTEDESAVTYQVPKFTDEEDDAARKELRYVAQLVQGGKAGALPKWVAFDAGSVGLLRLLRTRVGTQGSTGFG